METSSGLDFLVDRKDWARHRFAAAAVPDLANGQVLFRIDRFALTANNITYALAGDALGYWRFFPAPEGWGRLPVMGFGDVVCSAHSAVAEGTRCFGFFPMSRYLLIEPSQVVPAQIVDGAEHRKGLALAYNQYIPVEHDSLYAPAHEDQLMLLRGLFLTAFLAEDFLGEREAASVLISSASSKTSIALAFLVSRTGRSGAIGLTSARHVDFVRGLGCYQAVHSYDEIGAVDAAAPAVFVDMAGDDAVLRAVHQHLGARLQYSCSIGATHWQAARSDAPLPGPKPEFFFAPSQIQKRIADWGPVEFQSRLADAWRGFRDFTDGWLRVRRGCGAEAVARAYADTLAGRTLPSEGHVLSLWPES